MESPELHNDIWNLISEKCTPWSAYCLSLTCKNLMQLYRHRFPKSIRGRYEFGCGFYRGCDAFQASAIRFIDIEGHNFVALCENRAGVDTEFQRKLLLIDDYWRFKTPPCILYESLFKDPQALSISGSFPKKGYKPMIQFLNAEPYPAKASNLHRSMGGIFKCMWGKINIDDTTDNRGYRDVLMYVIPTILNLERVNILKLRFEMYSCRPL